MKRVVVESPYAGDVQANLAYAIRAVRDSLNLGEAPFASHLLYTQPGLLDDNMPEERRQGLASGHAWTCVAHLSAFYTDRGWSPGMLQALAVCQESGWEVEFRALDGPIHMPSVKHSDLQFLYTQLKLEQAI